MYKYKYKYKYGSMNSSDLGNANLHQFHTNQVQSLTIVNDTSEPIEITFHTRGGNIKRGLPAGGRGNFSFTWERRVLQLEVFDGRRRCIEPLIEPLMYVSKILSRCQ
jgi:hypothetical protein